MRETCGWLRGRSCRRRGGGSDTQWHQVVAWGKLAGIAAQYLAKGREVLVEGKLVYRQYEDKQGQKRIKAEIHAHSLLMLGAPQHTAA